MKNLLSIFLELFRISLFVIGGGYSILVVADRRFAKLGWTSEGEILDHLPVFQTIPGLIATHTAVYVGRKRGGIPGAVTGVVAVAIPAVAIFTGVTVFYRMFPLGNPWLESAFVGLRAALTGIIAATVIGSWRKSLPDAFAYSLMTAGVLAIGYFQVHVAIVLVLAMAAGLVVEGAGGSRQTPSAAPAKNFNSSFLPLLLFAQYGALCFGGGFVLVPMYLHDFIGESAPYLNIAESEFGDIMALSQMTPGPIGVNCATFFGYRLAGAPGALAASAMLLLPGSVLAYAALSSLEKFRTSRAVKGIMRGIRPASIALMLVALFAFSRMTVFADEVFHPWGLVLLVIATVLTMNRKFNVILLIVLCALAGSALRAESIRASDYPDADTVVIDDREDIEYFADGTYRSTEEVWTKALTEAGRRELNSESFSFSRRYGEARFAAVAIISEDGTRRDLDLDGLVKEASDNSSNAANIYDPLDRRIVCNIPGVKVGDTVYVKRESSTFAARCQNQWATLSVFEGFSPMLRASLRVKCPAALPLRNAVIRNPIGNMSSSSVTNDDGSVVMEWCATNSPQAFPEPNMPAAYKQFQHVVVSTSADWREMSKWYWELCAPHLARTNAAMLAKVDEIRGMVKSEGDGKAECDRLLGGIFKFVSQEIRYMGLTMEDKSPGYAPHDVDITFDKRYGVCRDKAGLLVAMLRLAGFDAYPVLIMASSVKMDPDVPSPYFNHAIVAVDISKTPTLLIPGSNPRYILLDPTAESTRDFLPSYESDCSYLVARPEGEALLTTPMPPADDNLLKIDSRAELSEDGSMLVESAVDFKGLNDNVFRRSFLRMKPTDRRQFFEDVVSSAYSGAKLLRYEIVPSDLQDVAVPLSAKLSMKVPEALLRGKTEIGFETGWLSKRIGIANMLLRGRTALEERRFPLRLSSTAGIEETLRVSLGETLGEPVSLPKPLEFTGLYEYRLSAVVTNGEYLLSRTAKVNSLEFSPAEYLDLRERIKSVEAAERRRSVFAGRRLANADIQYLQSGLSVDFTGERSWVKTNTVVKKILTYDGKKENSEMTFQYNPLVKKVTVLRASVTGRDGRTVFAGDKELSEFDCSWAASAPRYPASKKLVLTLPSVEVGSVITTVVETVVTDSPCAFRGRYYLDASEPTDLQVYRIGGDVRVLEDPERIPLEDSQPEGFRWRRSFVVDRADLSETCAFLRRAAEVRPLDPSVLGLQPQPQSSSLKAIRDWMAKHVRIVGPSIYEVPLEKQLTDPATVVNERYATRLDYVRALCALLKGAGYGAEVVFSSRFRGGDERYPQGYVAAVCRVDGLFLGTENEYTPLEATGEDGYWYLDPVAGKEDVVRAKGGDMRDSDEDCVVITVRPNGAVDYDYEILHRGPQVGGFRKRYEEMLPEERSRHYQSLLGRTAQSASATSELVTDTGSYPARLAYSCYIPDFAVVDNGTISLELPGFSPGFSLNGEVRRSPVGLDRSQPGVECWKVVFPDGFTEIENLPEPICVHNPQKPEEIWWRVGVSSEVVDGRLEVKVIKTTYETEVSVVPSDYFAQLCDWSRRGNAPSSRTLTVRR